MERIGLIGVGLLGSALAARLLRAGWTVIGFDRDPRRMAELTELGGVAAATNADVAQHTSLILLCLPDSQIVAEVLDELAPQFAAGGLIIDATTGAPEDAERQAARLAERQVEYVEATIAGSSAVVREGGALTMIGSSESTFHRLAPIVATWSTRSTHVGPCGAAARMKLTVNLVLGLHRAVLAEALSFGQALGLDPEQVLEVLMAGPAASAVMDAKGPRMIHGDFAPQARLSQHLKDVRLMRAAADRAGLTIPLTDLHYDLLTRAEQAGWGGLDNSAIVLLYSQMGSQGSGPESTGSP